MEDCWESALADFKVSNRKWAKGYFRNFHSPARVNSMADQNNNEDAGINCNLPKDAVERILVGLPVRSLLQFKSACKSWYNFIKSCNFIKIYRNHQISRPPSALISYKKNNVSSFWPDFFSLNLHPDTNIEQYNFPINQQLSLPFAIDDAKDWANFEFCYNGLICLTKDIYTSPVAILWNPASRRYKCINIPSECSRLTYLKLGFHQQSNDYKILKVPFQTRSDDESTKMAWVYTLSSGSWKTVPFTLLSLTVAWGPQISVDGFVYWLGTRGVEYIICFDLIKDKFKLMDVPDDRGFDRELVHRKLMVLRGSLAMIVSVEDGTRDTEIWMLVKGNSHQPYLWTKKFILEPFSKETTTLGMWNDHKLLVVVSQTHPHALRQVYSYDLVTKETEYFHMPKEQDLASFAAVRGCYFESLELEDGSGGRY
ncbi:F-box protein At3g08750-like [Solanum stenotomum]|uniref:F-box protein At3g08750-like n=1 Tax=Solanum stenotomum TaxID=172797 RepID=UPI0020D0F26E|nr:F-box protein At3g08750-like [Solanum stenotomum]